MPDTLAKTTPSTETEKVEIKHWVDGRVLFSCEVEVGLSAGVKLGAAVKLAFKAGASLDGASLDGASLDGASLDGASLDGASLDGASLDGASLDGASLDGASLDGASLDGASLDGASLDGASLDGASLDGASLDGARLDGASLDGASLDGASLDGASLVGARLVGARLDGASLVGASLVGARDILDCGTPYSWRVVVVRHKDGIRIAAGCQWLTFGAAIEHWKARTDRTLMPLLLAYIKAAADLRNWKL